ncbi:MFS transporter [Nocardia sp. NPDC058658]|uniref:MFS transporter n=1 Tax=Nocardia sp. NPDC058658 TaxID=3346580 RepID=UPI00364A60AA
MTQATPQTTARNRKWTTIVASVAAMVMTLDITVVNIGLPQIGSDLNAGLGGLQWVVNGYTLSFAALLLTAGALSDRLGRRRVFLVGAVVFTLASAACAVAWTSEVLIAARVVQGGGAAMMMGTALALIAGAYEGAEAGGRERAVAIFAAAGAFAATSGPIIGGLLIDSVSWRMMFAINIPICAFILYGALRWIDEAVPDNNRAIDFVGATLAVLFLFLLNYGLVTGASEGWERPEVLIALGGGILALAAFVVAESRLGDRAMVPLRLFRIPSFTGAMLLSFAARMVSFGLFPFLIIWLSASLGFSPTKVGLVLTVLAVALMVGAPLGITLAKRLPMATVLTIGMVLTGIGMFTAVPVDAQDNWTALLPMLLLSGLGGGLILPHLLDIAVSVVPANQAGTASGAVNSFFPLGTSASVAVYGALFTGAIGASLSDDALRAAGVPQGATDSVRELTTAGQLDAAAGLAPQASAAIRDLAATGYTDGLSTLFLVSGIGALLCGVAGALLVRDRDTITSSQPGRTIATPILSQAGPASSTATPPARSGGDR